MKKLLMVCAFILSAVTFANAQGGGNGGGRQQGTPEERAKRSTDQLVERLKLNDDQKAKVTAIYLENVKDQTKMREEMQGGSMDRDAMMAKMTKMRTDLDTKINAVLTDDQKKEYKVMQEERAKQMQNRQGGGGGGGK